MSDAPHESSGLGSLAQAARSKNLKSARGILIGIGILMTLGNGVIYALAPQLVHSQIQEEIRKAGPGQFDQAEVKEYEETALRGMRIIAAGSLVLGVVFIGLGLAVYKYPVPATALGLILYLGQAAIFVALNPASIAQGIIIRVIVIACLVKALQSALAYQKELQTAGGYAP